MKNNRFIKRKALIILLIMSILFSAASPQDVYARGFFQNIGHGLKKSITFVVRLPDKSTRWMGPVLGPIAAAALTANLSQSSKIGKIFIKAQKAHNIIEDIDQQKKLVSELKSAYKDQAKELDDIAKQIRQQRKDLASELVQGGIEYDDYMQKAVALEKLAQSYDAVAAEFTTKSERINEGTIIKLVTNNALKTLASKMKSAIIFELKNEIGKLIHQEVINKLLGDDLADSDLLIDMLVDDDISQYLKNNPEDIDTDALKERLREKIKQLVKEERDDLKNNWRERIKQEIENIANEMQHEKDNLESPPEQTKENKDFPLDEFFDDPNDECPSGYEWDIKVGDCKQINCNDIANAHWSYTLDCVCGSSGSIEENSEDPNKECSYSRSYESCPGCVYACVHLDEDCPLEGIGGY